jgi:hypothetical protein
MLRRTSVQTGDAIRPRLAFAGSGAWAQFPRDKSGQVARARKIPVCWRKRHNGRKPGVFEIQARQFPPCGARERLQMSEVDLE